jgi:hypothetical protein
MATKLWQTPVVLFFFAAGFPFVVSFAFFVISQRHSLLTDPVAYIASLKQTGSVSHMISVSAWKYFLARDPLCSGAEAIVIGNSRVSEIDETVVGTSSCNLYVNSLRARGFVHLVQNLPPVVPVQGRVAYVGIDHFWFLADADHFDTLEIKLLSRSRMLWKAWAVMKTLDFFTISDLLEAVRRYRQRPARFEDQSAVWYPDGHVFHPQYYARKRAGIHRIFSQQDVDDTVNELFAGQLRESTLRALETGVRLLHAKGYAVRLFWNPVSHAYIASARHHFSVLFQQTTDAVDRLVSTLPLDRYLSINQTLDASRFGCTERDYPDSFHVDVDCIRRVFAVAFPDSKAKIVAASGRALDRSAVTGNDVGVMSVTASKTP